MCFWSRGRLKAVGVANGSGHSDLYMSMIGIFQGPATECKVLEKKLIKHFWKENSSGHCTNQLPGGEGMKDSCGVAFVYVCVGGVRHLVMNSLTRLPRFLQ